MFKKLVYFSKAAEVIKRDIKCVYLCCERKKMFNLSGFQFRAKLDELYRRQYLIGL